MRRLMLALALTSAGPLAACVLGNRECDQNRDLVQQAYHFPKTEDEPLPPCEEVCGRGAGGTLAACAYYPFDAGADEPDATDASVDDAATSPDAASDASDSGPSDAGRPSGSRSRPRSRPVYCEFRAVPGHCHTE